MENLSTLIKESLHGQRKVDSAVNISVQIERKLYKELFSAGSFPKPVQLTDVKEWNELLGEHWHYRIFNLQGDFAFVTPGTLTYWITERRPLEEYSADGVQVFRHRGFIFRVKFVRGLGNKHDFKQNQL